ncbi:MAG: DUF839 domain-containing protein, partial [Lacisediminimonas sp.]|nr:DUF839 domain-containing protein [Lacisediminimonas sp.]
MGELSSQGHLADPDDIGSNDSGNPGFDSILQARLSRRQVLGGVAVSAMGAMFGALSAPAMAASASGAQQRGAAPARARLGFNAVAKSVADSLVVPTGYTATVLYALGDPLAAATAPYRNDGTDTGFEMRAGDHADGMEYFGLSAAGAPAPGSSGRGLLAMNHEAITQHFLHVNGASANPRPAAEADKEIAAHGVSIVEIRRVGASFATVQDSAMNRRITPLTPIEISGPARGSAMMKTAYSATGTATRGTINNCGTGRTPWGTLLTGEENWAGYFTRGPADDLARGNDKSVTSLNRYGRRQGAASRHGWETTANAEPYRRFNISQLGASPDGADDYRNELNGFGYIVEIDPYDKSASISKRTALGRFAHESAAFGLLGAGKPLAVYMGDDSRGEYIYKYVSAANWDPRDASAANRIAAGNKYLDHGKLHVAKFNDDGSGRWIELDIANPAIANWAGYRFADQADVLINARIAADAVGATRMDRPEWCGVHPVTGEIYVTLTNNSNRRLEPGAGQLGLDAANPRAYADTRAASQSFPAKSSSGNVNG